ncbi:MAG: hypothetical protein ACM3NR_04360 [Methanosarcina sp.]
MENKKMTRLMSRILVISLVIVLIGQVFKIQHYPYGNLITLIGTSFYMIFSLIEIDRLKKIIEGKDGTKE